jgi:sugar O-acyltransferase (sialic acid O-acetyltransferase NeuD family)
MAINQEGVAVIGAGGHAKVVIAALEAGGILIRGVFDDDPSTWGGTISGHVVTGPTSHGALAALRSAVIAVGDNRARVAIAGRLSMNWLTVIHPFSWVHASSTIGPGSVVMAGAVVQPDVRIGMHAIINTGATIDHDSFVDDFAHVCPGAHLAGNTRIGRGVLLGAGATVIPGRCVDDWATVGAGAAVVRDIGVQVTAVGVPARQKARS